MRAEIEYLLTKFPEHREKIIRSYNNNDEFKTLCQDYYFSVKTLEDYKRNMINTIKGEMEYKRLLVDLEKEISSFLRSRNDRQGKG